MNEFSKKGDLYWRADSIYEEDHVVHLSEELSERYPTAEIQYDKEHIADKAYPIYFWFLEIFFSNEADEAEFILRESL
jgi:hypothetical protein